jgi:hypothetical protein
MCLCRLQGRLYLGPQRAQLRAQPAQLRAQPGPPA